MGGCISTDDASAGGRVIPNNNSFESSHLNRGFSSQRVANEDLQVQRNVQNVGFTKGQQQRLKKLLILFDQVKKEHENDDKMDEQTIPTGRKQQHRIKSFSLFPKEEILELYRRAKSREAFFKDLSHLISEAFLGLSKETLELMNNKKLNKSSARVYLAQCFLLFNMSVLEALNNETKLSEIFFQDQQSNKIQQIENSSQKQNANNQSNLFKKIDSIQKDIFKYVRKNLCNMEQFSYVPYEVKKQIQDFNVGENIEHDLLRHLGFCFKDQHRIIPELKKLFNQISLHLDKHYPTFTNFMEKKVFALENEEEAYLNGDQIPSSFRKSKFEINPNISQKLRSNNTRDQFIIDSPEIYQIVNEWVRELEKILLYPQEEIYKKQSFKKCVVKEKGNVEFMEIKAGSVVNLQKILIQNLNLGRRKYLQQEEKLIFETQKLNSRVLKILDERQWVKKYIPDHEVKIIKYSTEHRKLISWLLLQHLILLIKGIIKNQKKSLKEVGKNWSIDLLKLSITDLFKGKIQGTQKKIKKTFERIKQLQKKGEIEITKIQNHFQSPEKCAKIVFKINHIQDQFKDSDYIICQLELNLYENNAGTQQKNIQILNNFFLELEESPYGVLAGITYSLDQKHSGIQEELSQTVLKEVNLKSRYPQQWVKQIIPLENQEMPIMCTQCTKLYLPYECVLGYIACESDYVCCKCLLFQDKKLKEKQIKKYYKSHLNSLLNVNYRTNFGQQLIKKFSSPFILEDQLNKSYQHIQYKDIKNFLIQKATEYTLNLKDQQGAVFLFVRFQGLSIDTQVLFWNQQDQQIEQPLQTRQKLSKVRNPCRSYYDFIVFLKNEKKLVLNIMNDLVNQMDNTPLSIPEFQEIFRLKRVNFSKKKFQFKEFESGWGLIVNITEVNSNLEDEEEKQQEEVIVQKQFEKKKVEEIEKKNCRKQEVLFFIKIEYKTDEEIYYNHKNKRILDPLNLKETQKNLPDLRIVRQNLKMPNIGVTSPLLEGYFEQNQWKNQIKKINLNNNLLTDVSIIFRDVINLQEVYLCQNFLQQVLIENEMKYLKTMVCSYNKIKSVKGLQKLPQSHKLDFSMNKIKKLDKPVNLPKLKEFNIGGNLLIQLDQIMSSDFSSLETLNLSRKFYDEDSFATDFTIRFKSLKKIILNCLNLNNLEIQSQVLEYLECNQCGIVNLNFNITQIRQLYVNENKLENFTDLFSKKMPKLHVIEAKQLLYPHSFEETLVFQNQELKVVNFEASPFRGKTPQILSPNLENLNLGTWEFSCQDMPFPRIKTPKLQTFSINLLLGFSNLENIEKANLKNIKSLDLRGQIKEMTFPSVLNLPSLEQFKLKNFQFTNFASLGSKLIHLPSLKRIQFQKIIIDQLPAFKFKNLSKLWMRYVRLKNIDQNNFAEFQSSTFPKLIFLVVIGKTFKKMPKIVAPKLIFFSLGQPLLENFCDLARSEMKSLKYLSVNGWQNVKKNSFPALKFPNLRKLLLSDCQIQQFDEITNEHYPCLQKFYSYNLSTQYCVKKIPVLKLNRLNIFVCNKNFKYYPIDEFIEAEEEGQDFTYLPDQDIEDNDQLEERQIQMERENRQEENQKEVIQLDISPISFWNCPQLQNIDFISNNIKKLPKMKFPKLATLKIEGNPIENFQEFMNSDLPSHKEFLINYTYTMTTIPFCKNSIYSLYMFYGASLKEISQQNLKTLKAEKILLRTGQADTADLSLFKQPKFLEIYGNNLDSVRYEDKMINHTLKELDLSQNRIKQWNIFEFQVLEKLNLNQNKVAQIHFPQGKLKNLWYLNLSHNKIRIIDKIYLPKLKKFICGSNRLEEISCFDREYNYSNLDLISLPDNKIANVEFLPGAEEWDLSLNCLDNLLWMQTKETYQVKKLNLSRNQITLFNKLTNKDFPSLKNLFLQTNYLTMLTIQSQSLETINASNNRIRQINIIQAENLQDVSFAMNQIQNVQWLNIYSLPQLSILEIYDNSLKVFPDFSRFKNLLRVIMRSNPFYDFNSLNIIPNEEPLTFYVQYGLHASLLQEFIRKFIRLMDQKFGSSDYYGTCKRDLTPEELEIPIFKPPPRPPTPYESENEADPE